MAQKQKRLLLLRHAKSDWDAPYNTDFERTLNERGKISAPLIGNYAKNNDLKPDLVFCSPAMRTRQTFELFSEGLGAELPVEYIDGLYGADPGYMNKLIRNCGDGVSTLMLIGHNPGMGTLAYQLTPEKSALFGKFPTASFAAFSYIKDSWQDFDAGPCKFIDFVKPRDLA